MAYAFLRSMGLDGNIAMISVDLEENTATASEGHQIIAVNDGMIRLNSQRYPFCADGPVDRDDSIRSGMTLVPFHQNLKEDKRQERRGS